MTDLTATDPDPADLAGAESYVHPLPPPPADGSPAPEEWLTDYIRGELVKAGVTLAEEEFAATVEMNRLNLQYPGRYVVTRNHVGFLQDVGPDGRPEHVCYSVREEVVFHSTDRDPCDVYVRSRPEGERRALGTRYVDEPGVCYAGGSCWFTEE